MHPVLTTPRATQNNSCRTLASSQDQRRKALLGATGRGWFGCRRKQGGPVATASLRLELRKSVTSFSLWEMDLYRYAAPSFRADWVHTINLQVAFPDDQARQSVSRSRLTRTYTHSGRHPTTVDTSNTGISAVKVLMILSNTIEIVPTLTVEASSMVSSKRAASDDVTWDRTRKVTALPLIRCSSITVCL
ncbi:hypothetical protein N656DRAFT_610994 [Canariomyces notabilis]|uniref:Uncharacterized protein n=1 Tax=Canariomyces notabilis TaxID=2074819 RepID=A0AAN6TGE8_9PEZI|nr:hypothetical protein N656DRAFT_610994 [Canariomyces arenarius]